MFNWFKKPPKVEEKTSDYNPGKDYMKSIREREQAEKKRMEKWRKEFKKMSNYSSNYTYSSTIGHIPNTGGSFTNSNNITTTSLADAKIRMDGGPNGSMKVDVPLIVNGRDVMKELDEMRDALLLLKRDVDIEAKYPELKEAYDNYMELYRGLRIADKLTNSGLE